MLLLLAAPWTAHAVPPSWQANYNAYCAGNCDGAPVQCGYSVGPFDTCADAYWELDTLYRTCVNGGQTSSEGYCNDPCSPNITLWSLAPFGSWSPSLSATATCPANTTYSCASCPTQNNLCAACVCNAGYLDVGDSCVPVATTKNLGLCETCTGNPVTPGTGNKVEQDVDYEGGGSFPLRFQRTYNSAPLPGGGMAVMRQAGMGSNWTHTYARALRVMVAPGSTRVSAARPDGKVLVFTQSGGAFNGDGDRVERLELLGNGTYRLTTGGDEVELYNAAGQLQSITNRQGVAQAVSYRSTPCAGCSWALMLHMEGPDGSRAVRDWAPGGQVSVTSGAAVLDGVERREGMASARFPGEKGDRVSFPPSPLFEMTGDFTVEGWFRFANTTAVRRINGVQGHLQFHTNGGTVFFSPNGAAFFPMGAYAANTWTHLAAARSGTTLRLFRNGALVSTQVSSGTVGNAVSPFHLGWDGANTEGARGVWVDEFRVVKGAALYTAAFTPPGAALDPPVGEGLLAQVADPQGRVLRFEHDWAGRLAALVVPDGGRTVYSYSNDGRHNLTGVTRPAGATRIYHYEDALHSSALTGITDENGTRYATFAYAPPSAGAAASRVVLTEHAGGAGRVELAYPSATQRSVTSYGVAGTPVTRSFAFQSVQSVMVNSGISGTASCPECGPAAQTYDANGNVLTTTDWNGNRTDRTYDSRNLETSRTEGLSSTGATTAVTRRMHTEWHPTLRVPTRRSEPLRRTTWVFNGQGATCGFLPDGTTPVPGVPCTMTVQGTGDPNGLQGFAAATVGPSRTWSFTYDAAGRMLTQDGPRPGASDVTTYAWYGDAAVCLGASSVGCRGQLASVTNALGHVTQWREYDANGNVVELVDPNGSVLRFSYDDRQRVQARVINGAVTAFDHDPVGNLTSLTQPDGASVQYAYDAAHRLVELTDADGNRVAYTLDLAGNRTMEEVYDSQAVLLRRHRREYVDVSRLARLRDAAGLATQFTYDAQGNVLTVTDELNRTTTRVYDGLHRVTRVTNPATGAVDIAYDLLDRVSSVTDARNVTTSYTRDAFDGVLTVQSPDQGALVSTYDAAGNLFTQQDALGQTTTLTHDAINRVTRIQYADNTEVTYAYDTGTNGVGRVTSVVESSGGRTFTYDQDGRTLSETRTITAGTRTVALTASYAYDASGRLTQVTYPSGRAVSYTRNGSGRVSTVALSGGATGNHTLAAQVAWMPFGSLRSFVMPGGGVWSRLVDQDGYTQAYVAGGKTWNITYDAAHQPTSIWDAANPADARTYTHDALGHLTQATTPAGAQTYAYDAAGNRTARGAQVLTCDATSNRLLTTGPPDARSFTYDANGSPLQDGTRTFTYDARGRLVRLIQGPVTADYVVASDGHRVGKVVTR